MNKMLIAAAVMAVMTGCAVQKTLVPVGGSRSDGTIKLAYQYGMFEKPVIDWNAAASTARQRCSAWGYSDAQAFGGGLTQCIGTDMNGACNTWQVTLEYQCMGQPEATKTSN